MKQVLHLALLWGVATTSLLHARDEQWLQYRTSSQAEKIVGIFSPKTLKLTEDKPRGVDLPEFKCDKPLFAYWPPSRRSLDRLRPLTRQRCVRPAGMKAPLLWAKTVGTAY